MAYVPASPKEVARQKQFMGNLGGFMKTGHWGDNLIGIKGKQSSKPKPKPQPTRRGGMPNLPADYKQNELAATIVAASHNPNAAGANPEARKILGIETPAPVKPRTSDKDKPRTGNSGGGGGRQTTTRVNSAGVKQTGTDMSARVFDITMDEAERLAGRGIADITKFQSEALPNTEAGQQQLRMQKEEEMLASGDYARISGGKNAGKLVDVRSSNKDFDKIVSGAMAAPEISLGVQKGSSPVADRTEQSRAIEFDDAVDDRFADGAEYGNDYVSDISPQRLRARAAFLNAENSLDGLRGAEAEMGYFAQGNKKFANVGGELQEVTKEGYSKGMSGGVTANELKDYYVKEVSKQVKEEQDPSPSREQQPDFLPDDENMLTFANSGEQKLLSDMTEEDWERANKLPGEM